MTDAAPKRRLRLHPRALTWALGGALIVLLGFGVWRMTHAIRVPPPEPPHVRMLRQVKEFGGPGAELRYSEGGQRRAVCGYVGRGQGGQPVGFVSTPNRILFSDDPLPQEYAQLRRRYCPGFLTAPPRGAEAGSPPLD